MKTEGAININSRLRYDPDNCDFSIFNLYLKQYETIQH